MSSCSAASRREAPPSTRAITRMRMSAEYAFGMARPPDESMPPDSPIYRESCDSIRQEHALVACRRTIDPADGDTARLKQGNTTGPMLKAAATLAAADGGT